MMRFGKGAQNALSALSLLAEAHAAGARLGSPEIARRRGLPHAVVAKILTMASAAGLVDGARGPGGGYRLSRAPGDITLLDIVEELGREDERILCPLGPGRCGHGKPCPMHDALKGMDGEWTRYLRETSLAIFTEAESRLDGIKAA